MIGAGGAEKVTEAQAYALRDLCVPREGSEQALAPGALVGYGGPNAPTLKIMVERGWLRRAFLYTAAQRAKMAEEREGWITTAKSELEQGRWRAALQALELAKRSDENAAQRPYRITRTGRAMLVLVVAAERAKAERGRAAPMERYGKRFTEGLDGVDLLWGPVAEDYLDET